MSTPFERPHEVPLPLAAELAAIPARTPRNWIRSGKLAAKRGQRGWLVRVQDIERIAIMIGHPVATSRPAAGMAGTMAAQEIADTPHEAPLAVTAAISGHPAASAAMVAADRQAEAEATVQRLLAPFIAEQTRLAEEIGRERARREQAEEALAELRRRATAAEAEADALRLRLAEVSVSPVVVVAGQEVTDGVRATETTSTAQTGVQGLWWRVRRVLWGG